MTRSTLSPLFSWRSAISSPASDLTPTTRHVALALSLYMSERGDSAWPGLATLVEDTGRSRSTVIRALKELEQAGWLEVRHGGGRGRPNRYRATCPKRYAGRTVSGTDRASTSEDADEGSEERTVSATVQPPAEKRCQAEPKRSQAETLPRQYHASTSPTPPARDLPRIDLPAVDQSSVDLVLPPQRGGPTHPAPLPKSSPRSQPPSAAHPRPRDEIWELLYGLETGLRYTREGRARLPRRSAASLNAAAAELRAAGTTPEELRAAIGAWARVMPPGTTCTAHAVVKHLPRLLAAARGVVFASASAFEAEIARAEELLGRTDTPEVVAGRG